MAISHTDHDHANTPAARAKCRKALMADTEAGLRGSAPLKPKGPVRLVGVAKANGTGFRAFAINDEGDLANAVPHVFSGANRKAWEMGWTVRSAHPYNDTEKRVEVKSPHGTMSLVWKERSPNAVWGVFFRPVNTSITSRIEAAEVGLVNEGIRRLAEGV